MFAGTLLISGRDWVWPVAGFLLTGIGAVAWAYWRAPADPAVRAGCVCLKLLGVIALLACLLEPLWSGQRARPGANYFAILADNSQGMGIKDRGETRSRGQSLRDLLTTEKSDWQNKLEESFQVRRYLFDSRLQYSKDFSELAF